MKEPQRQKALSLLRKRINDQANQKLPNLTKLSAWDVLRSTRESEKRKIVNSFHGYVEKRR